MGVQWVWAEQASAVLGWASWNLIDGKVCSWLHYRGSKSWQNKELSLEPIIAPFWCFNALDRAPKTALASLSFEEDLNLREGKGIVPGGVAALRVVQDHPAVPSPLWDLPLHRDILAAHSAQAGDLPPLVRPEVAGFLFGDVVTHRVFGEVLVGRHLMVTNPDSGILQRTLSI